MKFSTKALINMSTKEIDEICNCVCETDKCRFKPTLRKCREDGFCVSETYRYIPKWIEEDTWEIEHHEQRIEQLKRRIAKYKKWRKMIENDIEKSNSNKH